MSDYDRIVLRDAPAAYWPHHDLANVGMDATGHGNRASYSHAPKAPQWATLPNGDRAIDYNGIDQYLEVADADALSITHTGRFTIEVWMRPSSLEFASQESTGYVHFLGKGIPSQHEYAMRMYSLTTSDVPPRPNRISGYAFNLDGGAGSGAYFQDAVSTTAWNYVVIAFNTVDVTPTYPTGYVRIYRNGTARDTTPLTQFATIPQNGTAPLRIGTRNLSSFFTGAIGKVALYNSELTVTQILAHRDVMCRKGCP